MALCLLLVAGTPLASNLRITFLNADNALQNDPQADVSDALKTLRGYPLKPYLEYRLIERNLKSIDGAVVDAYLAAWPDVAVASDLKRAWLRHLASTRQDEAFLRYEFTELKDTELNCHRLHLKGEAADAEFWAWFVTAGPLGPHCTHAANALYKAKRLPQEQIALRISRAFANRQGALGVATARAYAPAQLKSAQRAQALAGNLRLADKTRPVDGLARSALSGALIELARRDHKSALALLNAYTDAFSLGVEEQWAVRREVAVFSAVAREPIALKRLADLPSAQHTAQSRMWRVRAALLGKDSQGLLDALDALSESEAQTSFAHYWRAAAFKELGRADEAAAAMRDAQRIPDFYGFAASAALAQPPALCSRATPPADPSLQKRIPSIARALELHAIGRETLARREWNQALAAASDAERPLLAKIAINANWYRQAVITLSGEADRRYYELRFPLAFKSQVSRRARAEGIDGALVYAVMRAESAFDPHAVSHANAHGLMQLLPETAEILARQRKLKFSGPLDLKRPDFNIHLGSAYLAGRMADHGNDVIATLAAYNAGPNALRRWQATLPTSDSLRFIELMPYAETREYVQRVIGFAMVYDYRMNNGSLRSLDYWARNPTLNSLVKPSCP